MKTLKEDGKNIVTTCTGQRGDNDQEDQNVDQEQSNDHHENGDCQQEEQLGMIGGFEINEREPEPLLKEVIQALREFRHGKSPGIDNIPVELWKTDKGNEVLHRICVSIWNNKEWPEDWVKSLLLPLPKKGDTMECGNNRTISLIVHASKVILKIISNRIRNKMEQEVSIQQAGFRKNRGTRDQLFNLKQIIEAHREYNQELYICFIDYIKAFDKVRHKDLWKIMTKMGFP